MFGIGETELVIIVVFAFLLFGPDKLPGMGRTLGRVLRQFREASDGFTEVVQTNIMDPASEELEKSPKQRKREAAELRTDDGGQAEVGKEQEAPQPRRETFAERKARLTAERKAAAEAAKAAEVAEADADRQPAADEEPVSANDAQASAAPAEPARTSAADLYALTPARSSRSRATAREDSTDASEDSAAEDEATTSGEEDGEA